MPYLVRAEVAKPGRGIFKAKAETKRASIETAQRLVIPWACGPDKWTPKGERSMKLVNCTRRNRNALGVCGGRY